MQERLIRQMRESLGLTQQGFADMLEVSQATVSRWEAGRVAPDTAMRKRIHDLVRKRGGLADGPLLSLIRHMPTPAALLDMDMRFLAISEVSARLHGVTPSEAIGMDYRPYFTDDLEEAYETAMSCGFFLGEGLGLQLVCRTRALRHDVTFHTISTWHILQRPSTGQPLLSWTARHVDEATYHDAASQGRVTVLTIDDWMQQDDASPLQATA